VTDHISNRRQFPRLMLSEDALAIDEKGRELGKVVETGGGGMLITTHSAEIADSLAVGKNLRITIHEPASQTSNKLDTVVRHRKGLKIGVQFIGSKSKA
jgi:hypothetical protein